MKWNFHSTQHKYESGQTLEQVTQRDYVVSISGDIKNLTGHSPGQSNLSDVA